MHSMKKSKREGEEAVGRRRLEVDFIIIIILGREYSRMEMSLGMLCNLYLAVVPLLTAVCRIFFLSPLALKSKPVLGREKKNMLFLILY